MSCLTKKLLFFMILSIVCNPTFANRPAQCRKNVKLVFYENIYLRAAFDLSVNWLSLNFIKSMRNTEELSNSLLQQFERFKDEFNEELMGVLIAVANKIGTRNVQIPKKAQIDIAGYFERLIFSFVPLYEDYKKVANPPAKFCAEMYKIDFGHNLNEYSGERICRRTLSRLLEISDEDLNGIDAVHAFKHCYLNYRYLDFHDDSIFSESGSNSSSSSSSSSSSISSNTTTPNDRKLLNVLRLNFVELGGRADDIPNDQKLLQESQKLIAKNYFSMLMGEINSLVVAKFQKFSMLFPTVEKYCSKAK